MAGLSMGLPIVTHAGAATDAVFHEGCVALAAASRPEALAHAVEELLASPERRAALGRRAAETYASRFSLRHTVRVLRALAEEEDRSRR
jgi:glycosyltransferase involved in cell wall biosynthesis